MSAAATGAAIPGHLMAGSGQSMAVVAREDAYWSHDASELLAAHTVTPQGLSSTEAATRTDSKSNATPR